MTYLQLVNDVLRRIREEEVGSVQDTTYSKMVGDFVNDAKNFVESAWDWSALRTTIDVSTTAGTFSYALVGSQNKVKVINFLNDTSNIVLSYQTSNWFDEQYLINGGASGVPRYYTYNGTNSDGDTLIELFPNPDAEYLLRFNCILRNPELSSDSDLLEIPAMPVIHLAIAMLARERGETGGTSTPEYFALADKYLSDAIALDAQKHPDEIVWYTP